MMNKGGNNIKTIAKQQKVRSKKQKDEKKYHESSQQQEQFQFQNFQSSSSQEFYNCQKQLQPLKMLIFIDHIYKKYKVLNKLTEEQSSAFQTEIISMLIDQNENLNLQTYNETVRKIGLSTFILQILATVIKRNKFRNQYEFNKNLSTITSEIEKQQVELTKRKKQIEKKQLTLKKEKESLYILIKEKIVQMQEKTKQSIINVENEVKKRINASLLTLKNKQKYILDKIATYKQSLNKIEEFQKQEKSLDQKIKTLDKKEQERKQKQSQQLQQKQKMQEFNRKNGQLLNKITQLETLIETKEEELKKNSKKIKTNELAFKHLKDEMDKKSDKLQEMNIEIQNLCRDNQELKNKLEQINGLNKILICEKQTLKQSINRLKQVQKRQIQQYQQINLHQLGDLDISKIDFDIQQKQRQLMIDHQQIDRNHNNQNKNIINCSQEQDSDYENPRQYSLIKQKQTAKKQKSQRQMSKKENIHRFDNYFKQLQKQSEQQSYSDSKYIDQDHSVIKTHFNVNPIHSTILQPILQTPETALFKQLHLIISSNSDECKKIESITQKGLLNYVSIIHGEFKLSKQLIEPFFQILLLILQPCDCLFHKKILTYLFNTQLLEFLQECFIKYEATFNQIEEKSFVILSRILLSYETNQKSENHEFKLKEKYLKCLKVRSLVEKDSFIMSNINFLLEYNC